MPGPLYGIDIFAPGTVDSAVLRYRTESAVNQQLLSLMAALAAIQARAYEMLGPATPDAPTEAVPADWLDQVLARVIDVLADQAPKGDGLRELAAHLGGLEIQCLVDAARGEPAALADLLTGVDDAEIKVEPAVILFVVNAALQPYLAWRFASDPALATAGAYPARRHCPACGGRPVMGKHKEPDGHRFLRCGACGHEWAYPRLACASCEESGKDNIEVIYAGDDLGRRLYLCNVCRHYLKVSDERLLGGPVYLPLEDIATLHLDELARERGFTPIVGDEA